MLAKTDVITTHAATLKVNSAGEPEGWRGIPMSRPMPVIPAAANGPITAYQAKIRKNDLSGLSVVFMRPIAKREPREAAAPDTRKHTEPTGCLPLAPRS